MATPRKIFRIEQMATAWSEPTAGDPNSAHDTAILRELGTLRSLLTHASAASAVNGDLARPNNDRLVSELRQLLAAIRGPQQEQTISAAPSEPAARIADELQAVVCGSEITAQRILTAAESIDQAANKLADLLEDSFERDLAEDIRRRAAQIFEACNFHDLTSQRIGKVRASIAGLDRHIARALDELTRAEAAPPLCGPRLHGEAGHALQSDIDLFFAGGGNQRA
jgi:chemotaxis protein CheZ